jgi:hypothetical protein
MKENYMKNEWTTFGPMPLHIPSAVAGSFRLAAAAFGIGRPYRDEVMQGWFNIFGALLSTEGGLSEREAIEYLCSMLHTLLPHISAAAREAILKSVSEHGHRGQGTPPGDRRAE